MNAIRALALVALLASCSSGTSSAGLPPAPISETTRVTTGGGGTGQMSADQSIVAHKGTVNAIIGSVWAVLPSVYDSLGIQPSVSNAAAHQYGNTGFEVRQKLGSTMVTRLFDCGSNRGGSSAMSYDLFVTVLTTLEPGAGATTNVSTVVEVKGKPITYSGDWVHCSSNGSLEQRILDGITARLK